MSETLQDRIGPFRWRVEAKGDEILLKMVPVDTDKPNTVGSIEINPYGRFYWIHDVKSKLTQQGVAGEMIDKVNRFLSSEKKIGLLVEAPDEDSTYAIGMYKRHGWKYVRPGSAWMAFIPEGVSIPEETEINEMFASIQTKHLVS